MTPVRGALLALLRAQEGSARRRIEAALAVLAEDLRMEVAFLGEFRDGRRVITHVGSPSAADQVLVGLAHPVGETLCHLITTGELTALTPDAARSTIAAHPQRIAFGLGSYAGIGLSRDGRVTGTLCCASTTATPTLDERDVVTLRTVAVFLEEVAQEVAEEVAGQATADGDAPTGAPGGGGRGPDGNGHDGGGHDGADLPALVAAVSDGHDLEHLTRPLLQLLHDVVGLESTYLTLIDWAGDRQVVVHSSNRGDLEIPEGLSVEWSDTLCRRSLDEGRRVTDDVPAVWGDSAAARELGITTYVSVPVLGTNQEVLGTLCAASRERTAVDEGSLATMDVFARLISDQLAREASHAAARARAGALETLTGQLRDAANRDPLTALLNRSGVDAWFEAVLPALDTSCEQLAVAYVDVDRFKQINDVHGHSVGDRVLQQFAAALSTTGRPGDLQGRLGGDEFLAAAVLPAGAATLGDWAMRVRRAVALRGLVPATASVGVTTVTTPGTSLADVLAAADRDMYARKRRDQRVPS